MRALILSAMLATATVGAYAGIVVGNGKVETESRKVPAFSSISFGGSGTLNIHRGGQRVEISCDSNVLPYVTTSVSGGELKIGFKPFFSFRSSAKLRFDITLPELRGLRLAGSGEAYIDAFEGDSFLAELSGSGGIKAELDYESVSIVLSGSGGFDAAVKAEDFKLRCSGSGGAFIRGSAERADIVLTGSAELGAREFAVENARVAASGSGHIEIRAGEKLDVALSGSGGLRYWGSPSVSQRVSGSGRIAKAGG